MSYYIEEYYLEENLPNYYKNKNKKLIKLKGIINNGKKEGEFIEGYFCKAGFHYYEKVNYFDNKKQGFAILYETNTNSIIGKYNYKDDKLNGLYEFYNYNGKIIQQNFYEDDILIETKTNFL